MSRHEDMNITPVTYIPLLGYFLTLNFSKFYWKKYWLHILENTLLYFAVGVVSAFSVIVGWWSYATIMGISAVYLVFGAIAEWKVITGIGYMFPELGWWKAYSNPQKYKPEFYHGMYHCTCFFLAGFYPFLILGGLWA